MRINKAPFVIGLAIACGLVFETTAHADEANQETIMTFSAPVEIPGQVLPAGKYIFRLADDGSNPNVVQILSAEGTRVYATLETTPTQRLEPTGNVTATLAQQGPGTPDALLKWYYPGSVTGHEFMYSRHEEKQLAHDSQKTIAAIPGA
jgi:hypothetical protein